VIYHITAQSEWEQAVMMGLYRADSLETDGFVHCSARQQVPHTAKRYFSDRQGLVLLCIDPARVRAEIRWEASLGDEKFPHIYGPLNVDAVVRVLDFESDQDGFFQLPAGLEAPGQ
jgi:uncharacterized protein (DUF952 family)